MVFSEPSGREWGGRTLWLASYMPGLLKHLTPASLLWPTQLWAPSPLWGQSISLDSLPVQRRSSSTIWPEPSITLLPVKVVAPVGKIGFLLRNQLPKIKLTSATESKLPTCHICILRRPWVITDSAPGIVVTDFNPSFTTGGSTPQPDISSQMHAIDNRILG